MAKLRVAVVGGGIFGVTAALTLRERGHEVTLIEPGPVPHPLAESTDISKVVRADYGADEAYASSMQRALEGFRRWNVELGETLFHETGLLFLTRRSMDGGGFERDSFEVLSRLGRRLERLDAKAIRERYPAWSTGLYVDGYWNPDGGFAESGRVVAALARRASSEGVLILEGEAASGLHEEGGRLRGVRLRSGAVVNVERAVLAAGGWTPDVLPEASRLLRTVGMPVFHLAPEDPSLFEAARFPVFGADIARTGYYGFPLHGGVVKIANHGHGREMHPSDDAAREVTAEEIDALRRFLEQTFPALAGARLVKTRVCVYNDSSDEHLVIGRLPGRDDVVISAGGSGHGFKFAPLLGGWAADALEGRDAPDAARFRPSESRGRRGEEAARSR
jgi:sarcosine oxidase / L-pipecolate oxidase